MKVLQLEVVSEALPFETGKGWAEELAWEHAKLLADFNQLNLGSDYWETIYRDLQERYEFCIGHTGYLHNLSARLLLELMNAGVAVVAPKDSTPAELQATVTGLISVITSALSWSYATSDDYWITDEEWSGLEDDQKTTTFTIAYEEDNENNE